MVVANRPRRGARLSSFYPVLENPSISDLDSAFQLQEYISLLIRKNPHDVDTIVAIPNRGGKQGQGQEQGEGMEEGEEGKNEVVVDEQCWVYEHLRRLAQDLTHPLITSLQQECNRSTCPEMKAGEWLYLCVAHGNESAGEQCCAIDYILHILDSATALLNSPRVFPSRISIPSSSIHLFSSLARRLGRIFAHAFFHHREAFEAAEAENSLYARFLALTTRFDLVPPELIVTPQRTGAGAMSGSAEGEEGRREEIEPPRLLAASLHPNIPHQQSRQTHGSVSPDKVSSGQVLPVVLESPRKLGRNRTDTMIFSDEFGEQLREQMGSPLNLSSEHDDDESEGGRQNPGGVLDIPHTDDLEIVASSDEECRPHNQTITQSQSQPYTLAFSASGSIKHTLPPGVNTTARTGSPSISTSTSQVSGLSGLGGEVELSAAPGTGNESEGQGQGKQSGGSKLLDIFNRVNGFSEVARQDDAASNEYEKEEDVRTEAPRRKKKYEHVLRVDGGATSTSFWERVPVADTEPDVDPDSEEMEADPDAEEIEEGEDIEEDEEEEEEDGGGQLARERLDQSADVLRKLILASKREKEEEEDAALRGETDKSGEENEGESKDDGGEEEEDGEGEGEGWDSAGSGSAGSEGSGSGFVVVGEHEGDPSPSVSEEIEDSQAGASEHDEEQVEGSEEVHGEDEHENDHETSEVQEEASAIEHEPAEDDNPPVAPDEEAPTASAEAEGEDEEIVSVPNPESKAAEVEDA